MKNILLLSLALLLNFSLVGQTKVDQFISINIPGNILKTDTIIENIPFLQYHSTDGIETYLMQRILLDSKESDLNKLPSDLTDLRKLYENFTKGQIQSMVAAGFVLESSTEFKIGNYIAYKIVFNNAQNGTQNAESHVLFLNKYAYVATYLNNIDFSDSSKNVFLNSLAISNAPKQMIGKSTAYKVGFMLGKFFFFAVLILGIVFVVRIFTKK